MIKKVEYDDLLAELEKLFADYAAWIAQIKATQLSNKLLTKNYYSINLLAQIAVNLNEQNNQLPLRVRI